MAYPLDSEVRLAGTFTNQLGTPEDPTGVVLYLQEPGQVGATQYQLSSGLVRDATGHYHFDLLLDKSGTWTYGWLGTGTVAAATFDIPLVVTPSILRQ